MLIFVTRLLRKTKSPIPPNPCSGGDGTEGYDPVLLRYWSSLLEVCRDSKPNYSGHFPIDQALYGRLRPVRGAHIVYSYKPESYITEVVNLFSSQFKAALHWEPIRFGVMSC